MALNKSQHRPCLEATAIDPRNDLAIDDVVVVVIMIIIIILSHQISTDISDISLNIATEALCLGMACSAKLALIHMALAAGGIAHRSIDPHRVD